MNVCMSHFSIDLIESLEDVETTVNAICENGATPLHYAARNGKLQVVQWLVEREADVAAKDSDERWTALHFAAMEEHTDVVALLLDNMDDADVATMDKNGLTALHRAAMRGHGNVVTLVQNRMKEVWARAGVDVAAKDEYGWTALHRVAMNGHGDAVALLLDRIHQAGFAANDKNGWTALDAAACWGHRHVVEWLENVIRNKQKGIDGRRS